MATTYDVEIDTNANAGSRREPRIETFDDEAKARVAFDAVSLADCEEWGSTARGEWCVSLTRSTTTLDDDGSVLDEVCETLAARTVSL